MTEDIIGEIDSSNIDEKICQNDKSKIESPAIYMKYGNGHKGTSL